MELLDSFLLGLIQGLTEFLPISSSGHLVLGEAMLGGEIDQSITFEVVVHFGTLCSILIYYRSKLADMLTSLWDLIKSPKEISQKADSDTNVKLMGFILLSMIPAFLVGVFLKEEIETIFLNPFMVSIMLLVTGSILYATKFRNEFPKEVNAKSAFGIGLAQAFAILPGISRSGSTISLGLYLGINRKEVANFSFLMVIPVIAGAMLFEVKEMIEIGVQVNDAISLIVGFFTAFISGYYALKYLIIMLQSKGIHPFAWYCWAVGISGLIYFW
ncbi:MAG: undecaprenyl-diphosphate phosphatase [Balneolaceae bacterium]|nr:undecaprenyl-diphosphate phosphatase [Balneolaceae bacterium]